MSPSLADFATSADIGRINPEEKILTEEIVCPKMIFGGQKVERKTMAVSQCVERIKAKHKCADNCKVAKDLRSRRWKKI